MASVLARSPQHVWCLASWTALGCFWIPALTIRVCFWTGITYQSGLIAAARGLAMGRAAAGVPPQARDIGDGSGSGAGAGYGDESGTNDEGVGF